MQILVLGMHRSGTSMVARLLNMMGAYFAPQGVQMPAHPENPKDFWERQGVLLCIRLLRSANCEWYRISSFTVDKIPNEALEEFPEQGRKEFSESQKEVHKVNAKISQQAADVARYQRRLEKLRELLSKAGRLLERALTSSRWRFGSLVLFRSRKLGGESDPRWRKRLLGELKAWIQQRGEYSTFHSAKDQSTPNCKAISWAGEQMTQMIDPQTNRYTALLTQQKIRARPTVKLSARPASK